MYICIITGNYSNRRARARALRILDTYILLLHRTDVRTINEKIVAQAPHILETNNNGREKSDTGSGRDFVEVSADSAVVAATVCTRNV